MGPAARLLFAELLQDSAALPSAELLVGSAACLFGELLDELSNARLLVELSG